MSRPRYFATPDPQDAGLAWLDAETARHLRARRLGIGDGVNAILGPGEEYRAVLKATSRNNATLSLGERIAAAAADPAQPLILLLALADPPRLDLVAEKATELGATELLFFRAARSQHSALAASRRTRLARIARLAAEQCGRTTVPGIGEEESLDGALERIPEETQRFAFSPEAQTALPARELRGPRALLIGPEGGFAPEELRQVQARGWELLSLGPRILRFETAALAALARWNETALPA